MFEESSASSLYTLFFLKRLDKIQKELRLILYSYVYNLDLDFHAIITYNFDRKILIKISLIII